MKRRIALLAAAMALAASAAQASVSYQFNLDTSSIAGTQGFVEFQFSASASPGGFNPTASALVSGFQNIGGSVGGIPDVIGHVSGTLPGDVQLDVLGDGQPNDYFHSVVFGSSISFLLTLSGQAVDAPICTGAPGTDCSLPSFALDLMNAAADQFLLTGDPFSQTPFDWLLAQVQINEDGSTTTIIPPGPNGGAPALRIAAVTASVPEPATWTLLLLGFGAGGTIARRRAMR